MEKKKPRKARALSGVWLEAGYFLFSARFSLARSSSLRAMRPSCCLSTSCWTGSSGSGQLLMISLISSTVQYRWCSWDICNPYMVFNTNASLFERWDNSTESSKVNLMTILQGVLECFRVSVLEFTTGGESTTELGDSQRVSLNELF